jgi:hypothetical protein
MNIFRQSRPVGAHYYVEGQPWVAACTTVFEGRVSLRRGYDLSSATESSRNRLSNEGNPPTPSAKGAEHRELQRHLEVLERRAADEIAPSIRASWEDQAEAVRALIRGFSGNDGS